MKADKIKDMLVTANLKLRSMYPILIDDVLTMVQISNENQNGTSDYCISADLTKNGLPSIDSFAFEGPVPGYLATRDPLLAQPKIGLLVEAAIRRILLEERPLQSVIQRNEKVLNLLVRL